MPKVSKAMPASQSKKDYPRGTHQPKGTNNPQHKSPGGKARKEKNPSSMKQSMDEMEF